MASGDTYYCALCNTHVKDMRRHERTKCHKAGVERAAAKAAGKEPLTQLAHDVGNCFRRALSATQQQPFWRLEVGVSDTAYKVLQRYAVSQAQDLWAPREVGVVARWLLQGVLAEGAEEIARAAVLLKDAYAILDGVGKRAMEAIASTPRYFDENGKPNADGAAVIAMAALEGQK